MLKSVCLCLIFSTVVVWSVPLSADRRGNCNVIFQMDTTTTGRPKLSNVLLNPVGKTMEHSPESPCNLIFAMRPTIMFGQGVKPQRLSTTTTAKPPTGHQPFDKLQTNGEPQKEDSTQPLHEWQMAVWPSDDETESQTEWPTSDSFPFVNPLQEEQLVVYPTEDSEDNNTNGNSAQTESTPTPDTVSTTTSPVQVLENVHSVHPNGTTEHKLVLSNGLVNYKKIYTKLLNGKPITVQEGYNSVPVAGQANEIQTQYYIADEQGHRVYRIEQHSL